MSSYLVYSNFQGLNNKTPIQSKRYWKYGWRGKTWEDLE